MDTTIQMDNNDDNTDNNDNYNNGDEAEGRYSSVSKICVALQVGSLLGYCGSCLRVPVISVGAGPFLECEPNASVIVLCYLMLAHSIGLSLRAVEDQYRFQVSVHSV